MKRINQAGIAIGLFLSFLMESRTDAQPAHDSVRGISTSHVILRLRADAHKRANLRRASMVADDNALPKTSAAMRTLASSWRVGAMRRFYPQAFAEPELAEKLGLDRTFVIQLPAGSDVVGFSKALMALPDVEMASPDEIGGVASGPIIPADSQFNLQWGLHNTGQEIQGIAGSADADIDAPEAWSVHAGLGSHPVIVALMDSGLSSHAEFGNNMGPLSTGRILPGWNTVLNSSSASSLRDTCLSNGHGTHVAGVIGAAGGPSCGGGTAEPGKVCASDSDCSFGCAGGSNVWLPCVTDVDCPGSVCGAPTCTAIGTAGLSWGVYLMPVKVLTNCSGTSLDLSEGIIWATDHGADIINMSLQYNLTQQSSITAMEGAVNYAHGSGVLLVAATGNNDSCSNNLPPSNDRVCYPARFPVVMAVSATDNKDLFGTFSNYGAEVDVAAPGRDIRSTSSNGSYHYQFGTSISTPHVSGLAALLKSLRPSLTNDELEQIIKATAEDRGTPGWDDHFGFGRVNAHLALLAVPPAGACCDRLEGSCEDNTLQSQCDDSNSKWYELVMCDDISPPCQPVPVPAMRGWGLSIMVLLGLIVETLRVRTMRPSFLD